MLARQAARIVARGRYQWPYISTRSFLEPATQYVQPGKSLSDPSSSSSIGDVPVSGGKKDSQQATSTSSDSILQSAVPSEEGPLVAPNAELVAAFATPAAATARAPTAAHRKLLQQQERKKRNSGTKAEKVTLASEVKPDSTTSPSKLDKGKGRATQDEPSPSNTTTDSTAQAAATSKAADSVRSFAEFASRSTPVSNSLFAAQPDDLPTSSSGSSPSPSAGDLVLASPPPPFGSSSTSNTEGGSASSSSSSSSSSDPPNTLGFLPFVPLKNVPMPHIRHPFNTYRFVARLEQDGAFNREAAEEIMRTTKALLVMAEEEASRDLVAKADVENEAYLFSAALSELRTEVQMTARTDAIALRSLGSQLQREVDSLGQKMREDIANLRNDNQLDLNNRKDEASADIAAIEQKILDLNNKFSLLVGDTKAALETSKWIQTRRSIVMIAGLALVAMVYLSTKPAPPPPAPPKPPTAEDLGLRQIDESDSVDSGFFGWLGGTPGSGKDGKKDTSASATSAPLPQRTV